MLVPALESAFEVIVADGEGLGWSCGGLSTKIHLAGVPDTQEHRDARAAFAVAHRNLAGLAGPGRLAVGLYGGLGEPGADLAGAVLRRHAVP